MSESDTQKAILDLIRYRGGVATRVNSGSAIFKGKNGNVNVIRGAEKGTSDILACYRGRYLAIEVKYGKGKPTPEQLEFGRQVRDSGGLFLVAYDVEEVNRLLDEIDRECSVARSKFLAEHFGRGTTIPIPPPPNEEG